MKGTKASAAAPRVLTGLAGLQPVEASNLHSKVYAQLRGNLMSGRFLPGQTLTLRTLAAALGTSVMPARDAVLQLSGEHALERSGRSVRVPVLTREQFADIQRMRIVLEGEAAAMAAERINPVTMASIQKAAVRVADANEVGDLDAFLAANQEFHFAIYRAARSPLLQSLIETLWLQAGPHLASVVERHAPRKVASIDLSAHRKLVTALRRGDPAAARDALRADLSEREELFDGSGDAKAAPKRRKR